MTTPSDAPSDKPPSGAPLSHECKFEWWLSWHGPRVIGRSEDRRHDQGDVLQKNGGEREDLMLLEDLLHEDIF